MLAIDPCRAWPWPWPWPWPWLVDAVGVVDAISAEDIGKFPDTNLAESLQRISGVSIDRSNGEGSKVTVRGFGPDFNLVTLNGRQMPTAATATQFIVIEKPLCSINQGGRVKPIVNTTAYNVNPDGTSNDTSAFPGVSYPFPDGAELNDATGSAAGNAGQYIYSMNKLNQPIYILPGQTFQNKFATSEFDATCKPYGGYNKIEVSEVDATMQNPVALQCIFFSTTTLQ